MGDRRCCCACPYQFDDFDRADSTDLGPDWAEISGGPDEQDIYQQTLRQQKAGNRVKWNRGLPRCWTFFALAKDAHYGDRYQIVIDWKDDDSDPLNYHYMELEVGANAAAHSYVRLRRCDAGAHSTMIAVDANGRTSYAEFDLGPVESEGRDFPIGTCLSSPTDGTKWLWTAGPHQFMVPVTGTWVCIEPYHSPENRRIVLQNGADQAIRWDDFRIDGHRALPNTKCLDCVCSCEGYCVQRNLVATATNIEGAARLHNWEIPLRLRNYENYAADQVNPFPYWQPDHDFDSVDERFYRYYYSVPQRVDTKMDCRGTYDDPDFELRMWEGYPPPTLASVVCDPLSLTWEFDFSSTAETDFNVYQEFATVEEPPGDPVRRHFTITVTEPAP